MCRFIAFLCLCALCATQAAYRQGDEPMLGGYCAGKGLGSLSAVTDCSFTTSSSCNGHKVLWTHPCEWHAQPFASASYQSKSASAKLNDLWTQINKDHQSGHWFSKPSIIADVLQENLKTTFSFASDQLPPGHKKIIHSVGVHSTFEWESTGDHPYTALFKEGSKNGILRFSYGAQPVNSNKYKPPGTQAGSNAVGISVKILRDGVPSANFVAMRPDGAAGQNSYNFFLAKLQNHVAAPDNALLKDKFATASEWVNMVGLKDFAQFNDRGQKTSSPVFPYMLSFQPTAEVHNLFPNEYNGQGYVQQISTLKPGTYVYDIYAHASPKATPIKIGRMKLLTAPVTSTFGDKVLFFQHRKMEFDFDYNKAHGGKWLSETSSKPVKSKFFAPVESVLDAPITDLDAAPQTTCPYVGTAITELAATKKTSDARGAYIKELHARIETLTEAQQASTTSSGIGPLAPFLLVALLAAVVGAVGYKFMATRTEAAYTTIEVAGP